MKIGVVADSHDNLPKVESAFKKISEEGIELVFHLGDYVAPFTIRKIRDFYSGKLIGVFGNNDGEKVFLTKMFDVYHWEIYDPPKLVEIKGKKFLLFHSLPEFEKIDFNIDYVLFAHTHRVYIKKGNVNFLNPGELCGYLTGNSTFLIIDIEKNEEEIVEVE